jgi:magnesium-transporting ATPase (P-type)
MDEDLRMEQQAGEHVAAQRRRLKPLPGTVPGVRKQENKLRAPAELCEFHSSAASRKTQVLTPLSRSNRVHATPEEQSPERHQVASSSSVQSTVQEHTKKKPDNITKLHLQTACGHGSEPSSAEFQEAPHDGLTTAQAEALLKQWGTNSLPHKHTPKWLIYLRLLIGPMPIMLWIASLIELIIGNYADMAILLVIQFVNAFISFYETTKAGDAVAVLKRSLKPCCTCKRNGKWAVFDATLLVPGDRVLLAAGSAIPADCYVNCGLIDVDQSAMTGESLPVKFRRGDVCKLGSTVVRGETEGSVESTGAHTFFGKTATMLQASGSKMGSLQVPLLRIMLILVVLSLTLCITEIECNRPGQFFPKFAHNVTHALQRVFPHELQTL